MKTMIALLRHEIAERRLIAAAGLLLGLVPLALPFLPNVPRQPAEDLRGGTALILAGLLSGALALGLGATVVGRDLGERRLGFFFARPLPGWAIWGGKMAAALALAWGAGLLVLLPALLLGDLSRAELGRLVVVGALAVLVLVPLAHAVGVLLRARSAWLLLDLIGLATIGVAALAILDALGRAGAMSAFWNVAWGLGAALFAALVAAGLLQIARGRTDLRRGHRFLSLTLWSVLLVAVLTLAGAARWVIAAPLSSLAEIGSVSAAPAGSWIAVSGYAAHRGDYWPAYLVDLRHGAGHRIPLISVNGRWWQPPVFSEDGRRAVWVEAGRGRYELVVADLADGVYRRRSSRLFNAQLSSLTLSPAGDRLATYGRGRVLVEDTLSGRLLASAPMANEWPRVELRFLPGGGRLRIFEAVAAEDDRLTLVVRDLPLSGGPAVQVSRLAGALPTFLRGQYLEEMVQVSPDGSRLQVLSGGRLRLFDVTNGRELANLLAFGTQAGGFLADGRWGAVSVASHRRPAPARLHLFSRDGRELKSIALPRGGLIGPLVAPELLAVQPFVPTKTDVLPAGMASGEALLVDLRSGRMRPLGPDLVPVAAAGARPGSLTARLFRRGSSELLLLDPATGALRPVLQAGR